MITRAFALGAAAILAACGVVPEPPPPYPTDFVPESTASPSSDGAALSPLGFDAAQQMTVRVRNVGCDNISVGTGFTIDEHTLVTNRHVVEDSRQLEISTYDGRSITATAHESTTIADLAIVRVEESLTTVGILATDDPVVGDAITVVGYPEGGRLTTVSGVVLGETADPLDGSVGTVLGTSAPVEQGSSGSPVLDTNGNIVGVIYAKNEVDQSFMIPVTTLRELLEEPGLLIPESATC